MSFYNLMTSLPAAGSDSDEARFRRRKSRSMKKSRMQCLPMNLDPTDLAQPVVRDRQRIGASLADVDPMAINREVSLLDIGTSSSQDSDPEMRTP